jgi:hypothetical protein
MMGDVIRIDFLTDLEGIAPLTFRVMVVRFTSGRLRCRRAA